MEYTLEDLIDIPLLQSLQEKLNSVYSFPSAIIDNDGKVLTAVAWQDICTKFHRMHPECEKECIKSDQYILEHLHEAKPAVSYQCPHGLIDNATPIMIDGKHLGNFFTGQFFLEQPELDFFKEQAKKFDFDEKEYLEAVKRVPIWNKEKLELYLNFIKGFVEIVAGIGKRHMIEVEKNKAISECIKTQEELEELSNFNTQVIESVHEGVIVYDRDLRYKVWNPFMEEFSGMKASEVLGKHPWEIFPFLKEAGVDKILTRALKGEVHHGVDFPFHIPENEKTGWASDTSGPLRNSSREIIGAISTVRDITKRKQAEDEMIAKTEDLKRMNRFFVNRELKMVELKKEVNTLLVQLGKDKKYNTD